MKIEYPKEPMWKPLEEAIGRSQCREFMFMGQVILPKEDDSATIFLYKHIRTRRYLNVDQDGRAYRFTGDGYLPIPLDEAIEHVCS